MFTVQSIDSGFDSYRLSDHCAGSSACVAVGRGGILTSFCVGGRERLYLEADTFHDLERPVRGGCPILFPACGRLKDGAYSWGDIRYSMNTHGLARDFPWRVERISDQGRAALTIVLESNEATRQVFPFDFKLRYTYVLKANTLSIEQCIYNTSDTEMPFSSGLHPYFLANRAKAMVHLPSNRYLDGTNGMEPKPFDGCLEFKEDVDHIITNLTDRCAILDTALDYLVHVSFRGEYRYFVVWSPVGADFVCVEPWTALPNALNTREDLILLPPGKSTELAMDLEVTVDAGSKSLHSAQCLFHEAAM